MKFQYSLIIAVFLFVPLTGNSEEIDCQGLVSSQTIQDVCGKDLEAEDKRTSDRYLCYLKFESDNGSVRFSLLEPRYGGATVSKMTFNQDRSLNQKNTEDFRELTGIGDEGFTYVKRKSRYVNVRKGSYSIALKSYDRKERICTEEQLKEVATMIVNGIP